MILPGIGGIFAGYSGTIPVIQGSAQISSQNSGTSFAPALPAHLVGDVLLVFVSYLNATANVSASAGWAEEAQAINATNGVALYSRVATGTAHTITISNSNNSGIIAHAYAIRNSAGGVEAAADTSADPPSLSPSWGAGNALWFAAIGGSSGAVSTLPTGFGDRVETHGGAIGDLITCDKVDSVGSLDPSAFTTGVSGPTITAAVQPGVA